jgi:GT2 family glycosyltransferase
MTIPRRGVTVVIPVFGNPEAFARSLRSAVAELDPDLDDLVVVDDAGPETARVRDVVDALAAHRIAPRFFRNDSNLGFVGTCNRAALEYARPDTDVVLLNSDAEFASGCIAALSGAIADDPRNGIASPRSDNATIATLPLRRLDSAAGPDRDVTIRIFAELTGRLPPYTVVPVANGFCFYIRRELLDRHGLFDPAFSPGYGEENDFCLRMAGHGHRSILVHGALAFHERGGSFPPAERTRIRAEHDELLVRRHPDYPDAVRRYLQHEIHPVDSFAEALVVRSDLARILVDVDRNPRSSDLATLRAITATPSARWTVRVPATALRSTRRALPGVDLVTQPSTTRVWDLAVGVGAPSEAQLARMTYAAPRVLARLPVDPGTIVATARSPIDFDDLSDRWASNAARVERTRALDPARPSVPRRLLNRVALGVIKGTPRRAQR